MGKRETKITSQRNPREEGVADDEWQVTLKDGTEIDARVAQAALDFFQTELIRDPNRLQAMYDHACGEGEVPRETVRELDGSYFTRGQMMPDIKATLRNGIATSEDGVRIVDPFEHNAENDHVLATMKENRPLLVERLLREVRMTGDDELPGQSR